MNIEDRVTILEDEISFLKKNEEDSLKICKDDVKLSHIYNNIDEFIRLSHQVVAINNKLRGALTQIKNTYSIAKNFDELYEIETKAKEILRALKIDPDDYDD